MKSAIFVAVEPNVKPWGLAGDFEENARFVTDLGFDGVELSVLEFSQIDTKKIKGIADRYQLEIPATASGRYFLEHGLFFSTGNREVREKAVAKIKEQTRVAGELGCNVIIGPVQGNYERSYEEGFSYVRDCLQECSKTAEEQGVLLLLEPINRYAPCLIRTIREGIRMVDAVGSLHVKLVADAHHMNIEETSLCESIRSAKGYLAHFHASDSNRLAPGQGHVDFPGIVAVLKEIGYDGYLSAEILPLPDQVTAARQTIQYLKPLL
ncbi:TIM barrel protein [Chloroflexota bacterium]